jgi:hypothetical protein
MFQGWDRGPTSRRAIGAVIGCAALLLFAAPATSLADEIEWMYDPDAVVEIHLGGLSEEDLDALEAEPDEYRNGTFALEVNGVAKGPSFAEVGIRRKGGLGSSRPIKTGKSGLKVKFDEYVDDQYYFGIKSLTLNNMVQDDSMIHEALTYELFHALDLPASRTGYAFVTLNTTKYGLFLNLETLDEISLPQWFPTTGHLYEADEPGTDVRPGEAGTFEVDEGDDEDLTDLEALIAAANDAEGDWSDGMDAVADLAQMTADWAVERYVGHWDGYAGAALDEPPEDPIRPNNYYLHSDAAGVFQMMPWGTDQTWEFISLSFEFPAEGLMFNKCLADISCKHLYLEGLTAIHCVNDDLDQGSHATRLAAMLAPYQDEEDESRRGYSAEEIEEEVENVEDFAAERMEQVEVYLTSQGALGGGEDPCATPPPPLPDPEPKTDKQTVKLGNLPGVASFGRPRATGSFISTPLIVPVPGLSVQRVMSSFDGQRRTVCTGRKSIAGAGRVTVRCRISRRARRHLESSPLRLRVRVTFTPRSGEKQGATRTLRLPKRP